MEEPTFTAIDYNSKENKVIEVWYRLWINPEDMMRIEPLLEGGDRIWMEELEMYYTFFYEIRNGRRVLGKDRIKEILDILL